MVGPVTLEVLIDAVRLGQSPGQRGIGTYMRSLIGALARQPDIRLTALATAGTPLPPEVVRINTLRMAPPRWSVAEHKLLLPRQLRRTDADVFHSPAFDPPRRCPAPWVQTIHDVIPLEYNGPGVDRRGWQRYVQRLRAADAVIAVSRWSADRAIEILDLDPGRVHVIHHGVNPAFHAVTPEPDVDPPYLLYVSAWAPYKGFAEACEVVSRLADAGYPHRLKMVGPLDADTVQRVRGEAFRSGHPERVDVLGFVEDLPAVYQRASALVVTSRMEGFGLPAAEAMAAGTPVIAFDNSALSEVVGGGGVLVPDGDVASMVANLQTLLDDSAAWREQSRRGRQRARAFDWHESARAHADVFHKVARA